MTKRNYHLEDFSDPLSKDKRKRKTRHIFSFCQNAEKTVEYEGDGDSDHSWNTWNGPKGLVKRLGGLEIRGKIETIQITALLKLDWRRFAVTRISVKKHPLKLVWKTCKTYNYCQKKKRICLQVGFVVLANHRMKIKESKNMENYLDLIRDEFSLVLWHINHCSLFNTKSIFIHINSTIWNNSF